MIMRSISLYVLVIISLFVVSCDLKKEHRKNVLFIIADDLNDNMGIYDHYLVKTPNIDKLAKRGLLFNQAFCNFPLCGPSRASMMTGLYPDQSGHHRLRDYIRDHVPEVTTMSQAFMNAGYEAARVGKIYHYDNPKGIGTPGHDDSLSWNERYYPKGVDKDLEDQIFSLKPGSFGAVLSWLATDEPGEEHTDGLVATKSIELLGKYKENNTPFFLGVGFYKPHTPYVAPKEYFEMYDKDDIMIPSVPDDYFSSLPAPAVKGLTRFQHQNNLSDSLKRCAIQAYYATISFLDAQVGRVVHALDSIGLSENTIIVFTSDHGYHMGEHEYFQKLTLFEHSGRIPLIIYDPEMPKGKTTTSFAEMIDLYPTLCELAQVEGPAYLSGKSLVPVLKDHRIEVRSSILTQVYNDYTVRTNNYRYTRWGEGGPGMIELYDRIKDPNELINLASESAYKAVITSMDKILSERIEAAKKPPVGLVVLKN